MANLPHLEMFLSDQKFDLGILGSRLRQFRVKIPMERTQTVPPTL